MSLNHAKVQESTHVQPQLFVVSEQANNSKVTFSKRFYLTLTMVALTSFVSAAISAAIYLGPDSTDQQRKMELNQRFLTVQKTTATDTVRN